MVLIRLTANIKVKIANIWQEIQFLDQNFQKIFKMKIWILYFISIVHGYIGEHQKLIETDFKSLLRAVEWTETNRCLSNEGSWTWWVIPFILIFRRRSTHQRESPLRTPIFLKTVKSTRLPKFLVLSDPLNPILKKIGWLPWF